MLAAAAWPLAWLWTTPTPMLKTPAGAGKIQP
jgi:hypothetical protein